MLDKTPSISKTAASPDDSAAVQLELLLVLIEDLSLETDLEQMAQKALSAATRIIGVDAGAVALLTEDRQHLSYRWYVWQGDESTIAAMKRPFNIKHGIAGKVFQSGRTMIAEDYPNEEEALQSFVEAGVCSSLATPIFNQAGDPLGIIGLASLYHKHIFSDEDVRLVEAIARQFSAAIQRHNLVEGLQKSSRALRTLSACNEVMMHASSEDDLLQKVCDVIVDTEGYLGAWFAFKGEDHYKSLTPRAVAGVNLDSLLEVEYSWGETKEGIMPPGKAARTGNVARVNNVYTDSECECCRKLAREVGYESVLALPIKIDDETIGVLVIYAKEVNAFSNEEILLLTDLGSDLSFGLQILRVRKGQREAAAKLRESEQQFKAIFENAQDGILLANTETRCLYTGNRKISEMLGYAHDELSKLKVEDIHPAYMEEEIRDAFQSMVAGKQSYIKNIPLLHKDGSVCDVDITASSPVVIGEARYLIGVFRDITERKLSEKALQESNEQLAEAQAIGRIGHWNWDIKKGTLKWSDEIYRIFGIEPETFGNSYEAFIEKVHPDDREKVKAAVNEAVIEKQEYSIDHRIQLPDGRIEYVHEQGKVRFDDEGVAVQMVGTVQNITERIKAEQSLIHTNRALRTLSRCNEIIVHAKDETSLLQSICNEVSEQGEFKLVWIGYVEQNIENEIRVVAKAGQAASRLENASLYWRGEDQGPIGKAIHSKEVQLEYNKEHLGDKSLWCKLACKTEWLSCITLPLLIGDEVIGVLSIYSDKHNVFGEEEVKLLKELSRDLAYGISSQRVRSDRQEVLKALGRSEHNLHNIISHEADGVMVLDDQNIIMFANPAICKLIGRPHEELVGSNFGYPISNSDISEIELINERGELVECEMRVTESDWQNQHARIVSVHDISQFVKLEHERKQHSQQQQEMLVETITAMSNAVETRDPYTAGHMHRVAELSVAIAKEMGLDDDRIKGIRLGGIIHDIGKLYVPAEILNRPGRLSPAEFEIIKSHAQVGYDIIKGISFRWPVKEMVYQHHERMDGSGYPNGLKGNEIVLEARILAVADVIEAMSSHRPYRPSLGIEPAIEEIKKNRGMFYEPEVVDACLQVIEKGQYIIE